MEKDSNEAERRIEEEAKRQGITVEEFKRRAHEADERLTNNIRKTAEAVLKEGKHLKENKDNELYKHLGYHTFRYYVETEFGIIEEEALELIRLSEKYPPIIFNSMLKIPSEILDISFRISKRHIDALIKLRDEMGHKIFDNKMRLILDKLEAINGKEKEE